MNIIKVIVLVFSCIGALDYLLGNKIGAGKEFEKAFSLFCPMALCMLGMIVIAPAIGVWLTPAFEGFYNLCGIDPSVIPASLFANDMGGMQLAQSISKSESIGNFNAFVISSMMGCMISFSLPFACGLVQKHQHKDLFFGFLCGIITVPIGGFVGGLVCGIGWNVLLVNLIPLMILSMILSIALLLIPNICIKCFSILGFAIKVLAIAGLVCSIFTFLTKIPVNPHFDTFENGARICANACVTLSGALPFMHLLSKLLKKPLNLLGSKMGINAVSTLGFLGSLATNASTFGVMDKMNPKGVVLNAAFAVSASFVFGSHLAFTMAFDPNYAPPMIIAKIVSGVCAVVLALIIYKEDINKTV